MEEIKIGDIITFKEYGGRLNFKVKGFIVILGQKMVCTDYGDINIDLIKRVDDENC